ncbi:helix-turn-helix domain-containing protein [Reichenbachiella ulvae]|uniref:helix-turn-helix domain-containing protein n=1 Tax=Reichenbachiella ulvae TaxID=2980104 RepID=UPI003850CF4B
MAFGKTLKKLRLGAEMTQEQLVLKSGLHPTYISHLETGKKQPKLTTIFKLSKCLSIGPERLFLEML